MASNCGSQSLSEELLLNMLDWNLQSRSGIIRLLHVSKGVFGLDCFKVIQCNFCNDILKKSEIRLPRICLKPNSFEIHVTTLP